MSMESRCIWRKMVRHGGRGGGLSRAGALRSGRPVLRQIIGSMTGLSLQMDSRDWTTDGVMNPFHWIAIVTGISSNFL